MRDPLRTPRSGRRAAPLAALLLGALCAGCVSDKPDTTQPGGGQVAATVQMTSQLRFDPATVTIKAGQAVRWHNAATFTHTATADPALAQNAADVELPAGAAAFNSGALSAGAEFTHTFTTPGTYRYFCIPHEGAGMLATVVVTP